MTSEYEILRQQLQAEVRQMAAIIRQFETVSPGCFGQAAALIRQQAAGDDVSLDDLMAALASVRLTLREAAALCELSSAERKAAEDKRTALISGGPLGRAWRALWWWRGRP